jgi:hypothetical protein
MEARCYYRAAVTAMRRFCVTRCLFQGHLSRLSQWCQWYQWCQCQSCHCFFFHGSTKLPGVHPRQRDIRSVRRSARSLLLLRSVFSVSVGSVAGAYHATSPHGAAGVSCRPWRDYIDSPGQIWWFNAPRCYDPYITTPSRSSRRWELWERPTGGATNVLLAPESNASLSV